MNQIVSMRATTPAGFNAMVKALSTIYPGIVSEGEVVGGSAAVAAFVGVVIVCELN